MDRTQGLFGWRLVAGDKRTDAGSEAGWLRSHPLLVFARATTWISAIGGTAQYYHPYDRTIHQGYET